MITNRTERRSRVIETIVAAFLETGKPVNSAFVSEECGLGLKPASIRSIMKELEDDGYLEQPHTSAGRIPTVKCYRYYVRYLMPMIDLPERDVIALRRAIEDGMREQDAELFLHHMASVLSELTDLVGVALSTALDSGRFQRLEIVNLGGSSFLLVLSLESGYVNTIRITLDRVIPARRVEETARLLTGRLQGLTVAEIKNSLASRLENVNGGDRRLVEVILDTQNRLFSFPDERNMHIAGLSRALALPEFTDADHSLKLVSLFEEKEEIANTIRMTLSVDNDVSIHIGGGGYWGSSPPLSLVTAAYRLGSSEGAIGVIGPARIYYPRLSALLRYAAAYTSHVYST
jgi:heat-inducible transcriptional repressor